MFKYFINVFRGKHKTNNINLRMMHGINKISIIMFLFALVLMAIKCMR
jgi:hypothetical protein